MLKNKNSILKIVLGLLGVMFLFAGQLIDVDLVSATVVKPDTSSGPCYCETKKGGKITAYGCYGKPKDTTAACNKKIPITGGKETVCSFKNTLSDCVAIRDQTQAKPDADFDAGVIVIDSGEAAPAGSGSAVSALIPECALKDAWDPESNCADVSIFVELLFKITNYLFTIIGALALLMFIYGGVMMIISQGNPEGIKKGTDAMKAAVIGLVIAFAGYALIKFLGDSIGLKETYRLK